MRLKQEKLNELLRQEISKLILTDVHDPRIGFVTVNRVETNSDLSIAKVYITVMGKDTTVNRTVKVLNSAKDFIKVNVSKKIRIRFMPELTFLIDTKTEDTINFLHKMEEEKEKQGY
ncbi:MAG: 30S ribosome-binding factor RbfA [Armatimonadetes bacterium]|nr:30S ribosome-binding factor RbfA [Candidatus Hippobium faecium]